MSDCLECNLCSAPGTRANAREVGFVPCHVRCFHDKTFTVWRCKNCNSLHSQEEVDLLHYYDRYPFKDHKLDFHTRVAYRNRLRMLKAAGVRPTDSILDFGCGKGLFVALLRQNGFQNVLGYDAFIPEFADPAVLERSYDAIVSYDVIEHVESPRSFFQDMVARLNPGGRLLIGTPNATNIPLHWKQFPPVELSQPYHRHILSEQALRDLGAAHGLNVGAAYHRFYFDTLVPSVNTRFIWEYVFSTGGFIDVCVKPLRLGHVLRSPRLIFFALFGYLFPPRGNMMMVFRKPIRSEGEHTVTPSRVVNQ